MTSDDLTDRANNESDEDSSDGEAEMDFSAAEEVTHSLRKTVGIIYI